MSLALKSVLALPHCPPLPRLVASKVTMPLAIRYVEPKNVCSSPLLSEEETRAGDALAAVTIRSLSGLIRQLSSLARHAEGVMGELVDSLTACHERTASLERRTTALKAEVLPKLDPDREGTLVDMVIG